LDGSNRRPNQMEDLGVAPVDFAEVATGAAPR
jgi:hypothetical protein